MFSKSVCYPNKKPGGSFREKKEKKEKKSVPIHSSPKQTACSSYVQRWLVVVGGWRLVAVGGWQLATGGWWQLAVVGGWRLVDAGGWRLGSWWLAVGGPLGQSLTKKKSNS
jgi:hypothetical protein